LNRILIEAESEAAHNAQNVARAILTDDRFKNHRTLISRFAGFLRILWLNPLNNAWRSYTTTNSEYAATKTAALTRSDAGTFAFTNSAA
jgi:hypothetical protein